MITVKNPDIYEQFRCGDVVFKVTATSIYNGERSRDVGMVTTNHNYERSFVSHKYNPLLYTTDKYTRLAYVSGCLNTSFRKHRKEYFTFWWRRIGERRWREWFIVEPYIDSLYDLPIAPWKSPNFPD